MRTDEQTAQAKAPLSRERIVLAAVELADREGIEAVTMRKLADVLAAGAMSLYYYVPNKDDLLDGMIDAVKGEIEPPASDGDWRTELRKRATSTRHALQRHGWAVGLMESRTQRPGPANLKLHDAVLGCLREAGFSIEDAIHAYSVQDAYIYGFALQEQSVPAADEIADVVDRQVEHIESNPEIEALAEAYPYLAEVVAGYVGPSGYDFGKEFEYGLDLILDALEQRRTAG